jgi:DNA-binding response OmpR family regulator
MSRKYTLLIADNNIHVRNFLARELNDPDYDILQAANHMQLFSRIYGKQTPDLIVFDLDIPYINCLDVLRQIQDITPPIPVIVYTYLLEYKDHPLVKQAQGFVEKSGDIIALREKIAEVLRHNEPGQRPDQAFHDLKS